MLFPMHAVNSGGQCVCVCACACMCVSAAHTGFSPRFPASCQLPHCVRMGEARLYSGVDCFT